MLMKAKPIILTTAIVTATLLAGCTPPSRYHHTAANSTLPANDHQKIIQSLEQQHVQVVQLGDILRLILPSDVFFEPNSSEINPNMLSTLTTIAQLLRSYNDAPIQISGHSDNVASALYNQQITNAQAHNISAFFWSQGVPLNTMTVLGKGQNQTVASNTSVIGSAMNRRIEIFVR